MNRYELQELLEQLDNEQKELIAVTEKFVLVYWHQDYSYVSWRHYYINGKFVFEIGEYWPVPLTDENTDKAIKKFAERINND